MAWRLVGIATSTKSTCTKTRNWVYCVGMLMYFYCIIVLDVLYYRDSLASPPLPEGNILDNSSRKTSSFLSASEHTYPTNDFPLASNPLKHLDQTTLNFCKQQSHSAGPLQG